MTIIDAIHQKLWTEQGEPGDEGLVERISGLVDSEVPLASGAERARLVAEVTARVTGLGPLQPLADDAEVSEIMVNAGREVWVERAGELSRADVPITPGQTEELVRRLAAACGRRVDRTSPSVDVRMADGSRLHAILQPLAVDGPCVTIRRFGDRAIGLEELASEDHGSILRDAVDSEATIVVAGATSSGKTTLLNALTALVDPASRLVTVEDAAELRVPLPHVVRLEARPETAQMTGVGVRHLVREALRMRPDRIICGEMRGAEALDLVQAMNTGHRGSLTTVHANSPSDAMRRIETMMLLGDADLPLRAIREQLASCIDLVVMIRRGEGAQRRVSEIASVPAGATEGWELESVGEGGRER